MSTETRSPTPDTSSTASPRRWAILAVLCVSLLIVSLDNTILNIALPALVRDLHATESQLEWIVDIYACVFAGLLLVAGSIGDRVGRKKVFCVGLAIFAAGSAGSAFSTSVTALIVARSVMGLGAACIMPATLSIIINVFREPDDQARAIGIWSATTGLGIAIGPIAGGWLLAHYWWGSVFLVNVPVATLGLSAALWLVPDSRDPERRPIDVLGAVLSTVGLAMLLWSIIEAPVRGWDSPFVLASGVGAVVVLSAFVVWERHTTHPMLTLKPFADRRFSVAMAAVAMAVFGLMGALFVLTQYLQFSLGFSALDAGVRIVPIAAVLAVAAVTSTVVDRVIGTKVVVAVGMCIVAAGLWQLTTTTTAQGFGHSLIGMILLGLGAGLIIAPATASVMGSLSRDRAGVGSATNSTALQVGGALGVAVIGSVLTSRYQGRMTDTLAGHSVPPAAAHAILGSIGGALAVARMAGGAVGTELTVAARRAFVDGMDLALLVGAVVVAASALLVIAALPSRRRVRPDAPSPEDHRPAVPPTGSGEPPTGSGDGVGDPGRREDQTGHAVPVSRT
ncbi:MAG TPA: MFS transporter [Acidimicrobiales bacterium]|nr:MFS transporter [Acidimicrobiales bacterium]